MNEIKSSKEEEVREDEEQHRGLAASVVRGACSGLIKIAAEIVRGNGFLSPYADDNPKSTPRLILEQANRQQEKLKDWAVAIRHIVDTLSRELTRSTGVDRGWQPEAERVLGLCEKALRSLPTDGLGQDPEGWFYRDELLSHIARVLPSPPDTLRYQRSRR